MTNETGSPRSRRALLAAALGAGAASVASALGRPSPASAVSGTFDSASSGTPAVAGFNFAATGFPASGVYGKSMSSQGAGVYGEAASMSGHGINGHASALSGSTIGVLGFVYSTSGIGVSGNASAVSGSTIGVAGSVTSSSGMAVSGHASAGSGSTFGVSGRANSTSGTGVSGRATAASGSTYGLYGRADSTAGTAVLGYAGAPSGSTHGVLGYTASPAGTGAGGWSGGNATGMIGYSNDGSGSMLGPVPKTGVYGRATQDATSRGVFGYSTAGQGIRGQATTGTAVYASTPVVGDLRTGIALRADGRVKLTNCAGVATITNGTNSVLVSPGIDLGSASAVVASLMGSAGGTTTVHRSVVNATANTFRIYLTAASTADVRVAWHVFG